MAVVYRARDSQLLRDVAVKVLHPHLASDPESRQRFLREAQAAARLRHPNIVEVFDFSVESDRESFMVSELLEGPTLRRFAEQHPGMPTEIAAAIGIVLCGALSCAHGQGVIHRDVKPDNILLQTGGLLKLTDFGIAHVADGGGMTVTGQVLGSPAHMAPEQIEGRRIDARADLFAAGTVLYSLAVGRLPFEAPNAHALLRKILEVDYPDPLRAAPTIGHRFAAIIRRCLAREPEQRYESADALRVALREYIADIGWEAAEPPLKEYFADPEAFAKAHRDQLLERLPDLGVRARKAGRLPDALGYFNRALSLDPANAKVLGLVRAISRRRRIKRIAAAAGIVVVTAAVSATGVLFAVKRWEHAKRMHVAAPAVRPDPVATTGHGIETGTHPPNAVNAVDAGAHIVASTVSDAGATGAIHVAAADAAVAVVAPVSYHVARVVPVTGPNGARVNARVIPAPTPPAAGPERVVSLRLGPQGVGYYVDRGPLVQYGPPASRTLTLSVGRHTFRVVSNDPQCEELTWSQDIAAGAEPLSIGRTLRCQ